MHANVYFSAFFTEAFIGLEKMGQRAANMPKAFSINRQTLESQCLKICCSSLSFPGKGLINQVSSGKISVVIIRVISCTLKRLSRKSEKSFPDDLFLVILDVNFSIKTVSSVSTFDTFMNLIKSIKINQIF